MNSNSKIEQQTDEIQKAVTYLRKNLGEIDEPIFIELIGTPKSGKTTLVQALKNLLEKNNVPAFIRRETAEYNPIQNKSTEEYNMWMIMELIKNLTEDLSNQKGKIVIYDRGLLDRIPWIDYGVEHQEISLKDRTLLKQFYDSDLLQKYRPLAYAFKTSPELSVQRKGKEGRLVNIGSITLFNHLFDESEQFVQSHSTKYQLTKTDGYQGELQRFIIETVAQIMRDSQLLVRHKLSKEKCK